LIMEKNKLDNIFNIAPTAEAKLPARVAPARERDQEDDYQLARTMMRKLIYKGEDALDDAVELAKNSEHPRAYEVAGQMIKTMSDVAKDLLNLQKQAKDLSRKEEEEVKQIGTQNNIVFAGSTQDLIKMLKDDDANTIDAK
jgi:hypothetical protein